MSGGVGDEVSERAESVKFKAQRKSPQIVSAIRHVIFDENAFPFAERDGPRIPVDIFTKGLPSSVFTEFRSSLNVQSG